MMEENMKLWSAVEKTDTRYTKYVSQRGGFTSVNPQYQIKMATEQFGPYGGAWGFSDFDLDFSLKDSGLVIFKGLFFYPGGKFPIINSQKFAGKQVDDDFAKKLETDTLTKALSKIGFNADVFMGHFDDNEYVKERQDETALQAADDKEAEKLRQKQEHYKFVDDACAAMEAAGSLNELQGIYKQAVRRVQRKQDDKSMKRIARIKDAKKIELTEKEQANDQAV